jgi:DNA processing protein
MVNTNLDHLLALNAVPGLGPQRIRRLIAHFNGSREIFRASEKSLSELSFLPASVVRAILDFPFDEFLKKEHALLKEHKAFVLSIDDPLYPQRLKEIPDAPVVLYAKGERGLFDFPSLAIVGCRKSSVYGMTMAEKFAKDLSDYGLVVVSGLARGIDTAAHHGALKVNGKTVAVLGTGLTEIYPAENKRLFEAIADKGLVVSEFPMSAKPSASHFPRRNRIISGLSLGVIVVEAARKSGALITADFALEQGREVFAIPGKIDSPSSQGTNALIKQGAKLVGCVDDILEELQIAVRPKLVTQEKLSEAKEAAARQCLLPEEKSFLKLLSAHPMDVDSLCQESGLALSCVFSLLLKLELLGIVKQLPGKLFVLK